MRISLTLAASAAAVGLLSQFATADLVLQYNSPAAISAGGTVPAAVGPNGTAYGPIAVQSLGYNSYGLTRSGGSYGTGWTTGTPFSSFTKNGTTDESFTAFALVQTTGNTGINGAGDRMVFGTDGVNPLHLGIRDNYIQYGMWGNDSAGGTAPVYEQGTVLAWRFEPDPSSPGNYIQSIFINGVDVSDSGGHGSFASAGENLVIGTSGNNGDFNGGINDIRWYNDAESNTSVAAISAAMITEAPEPASLGLAAIGALAILGRRRQK